MTGDRDPVARVRSMVRRMFGPPTPVQTIEVGEDIGFAPGQIICVGDEFRRIEKVQDGTTLKTSAYGATASTFYTPRVVPMELDEIATPAARNNVKCRVTLEMIDQARENLFVPIMDLRAIMDSPAIQKYRLDTPDIHGPVVPYISGHALIAVEGGYLLWIRCRFCGSKKYPNERGCVDCGGYLDRQYD